MADLSQDQLTQLCKALGWQGGTFWQVLDAVKALVAKQQPASREPRQKKKTPCRHYNLLPLPERGLTWVKCRDCGREYDTVCNNKHQVRK